MGADHGGHGSYFVHYFGRENSRDSSKEVADEENVSYFVKIKVIFGLIVIRKIALHYKCSSEGV